MSPRNNRQQAVKALPDIEEEFYDSLEQSVSAHANAFCLDLPKDHSELPDFIERVEIGDYAVLQRLYQKDHGAH